MHKRLTGFLLSCAVALALSPLAIGQSAPPANRPTPRTSEGKPDLNGLWGPDRTFIYDISSTLKKGEVLPLQPWAEKLTRERMSNADPEANCLPAGVPRMAPYPWKIVQQPKLVVFLFEGNIHTYRQIFMDGRGHPADPDPTWYGHSIGKWEGDSLVVDTIGFNDKFWFDSTGRPHSEKLHTVERFTRTDLATLVVETTIDDATYYTKPFTISYSARLRPGEELMEYICQENEQDMKHLKGLAATP
jgi:hypothetical protein